MQIKLYQIDAFADDVFSGNQAAVCPLDAWLDDELMQQIAAENNLSETAFFVATNAGYHIRWFTPTKEVKLCGHATLASAYVIFNVLQTTSKNNNESIVFDSLSGELVVTKKGDYIELDFPATPLRVCEPPADLLNAFSEKPLACLQADDYVLVFENEASIARAQPNFVLLSRLNLRGVAITAPGNEYDFVSRFFAPNYGINEDPVTGSSFTQLIPYWSEKLNKKQVRAKQISKRGGVIKGVNAGDRVKISGKAVKFMQGVIEI